MHHKSPKKYKIVLPCENSRSRRLAVRERIMLHVFFIFFVGDESIIRKRINVFAITDISTIQLKGKGTVPRYIFKYSLIKFFVILYMNYILRQLHYIQVPS